MVSFPPAIHPLLLISYGYGPGIDCMTPLLHVKVLEEAPHHPRTTALSLIATAELALPQPAICCMTPFCQRKARPTLPESLACPTIWLRLLMPHAWLFVPPDRKSVV